MKVTLVLRQIDANDYSIPADGLPIVTEIDLNQIDTEFSIKIDESEVVKMTVRGFSDVVILSETLKCIAEGAAYLEFLQSNIFYFNGKKSEDLPQDTSANLSFKFHAHGVNGHGERSLYSLGCGIIKTLATKEVTISKNGKERSTLTQVLKQSFFDQKNIENPDAPLLQMRHKPKFSS